MIRTNITSRLASFVFSFFLLACGNESSESSEEASTADHEHGATASEADASSKSPRTAAMTNVGDAHVHIDYSSPKVRGRVIWGGLVPYGEVWVTGAHRATSVNFPTRVRIVDTELPAGKYGIFTIPGESEWTIIVNENWDQHLADDYDPELDVVRIQVMPEIQEDVVEDLTYEVKENSPSSGTISIAWEKIRISFDFETLL